MSEPKALHARQSVEPFLRGVPAVGRQRDGRTLVQIMRQVTKCER